MKKLATIYISLNLLACVPEAKRVDLRTHNSSESGAFDVLAAPDVRYKVVLSSNQKHQIATQIFKNETGGERRKLVHWNQGEGFPSLGIAHFIWIPKGVDVVFGDSFKKVISYYLDRGIALPPILSRLAPSYDCPWQTNTDFWASRASRDVMELEEFLLSTFEVQTDYLFERLKRDLPGVFVGLSSQQVDLIDYNLERLIASDASWYPVVDYLNFKGSGSAQIEVSSTGGWGLRQVLLGMEPKISDPKIAFANSAKNVLAKRAELRSYDKRWLSGWNKRIDTYTTFKFEQSNGFEQERSQ